MTKPECEVPAALLRWVEVPEADVIGEGEVRTFATPPDVVLLGRSEGQLFAFDDQCAHCGQPLSAGVLEQGYLRCIAGHRFDVRRGGIDPGQPEVHLDAVPLLSEEKRVRVGLPERDPP